jgi:hypothetical protein
VEGVGVAGPVGVMDAVRVSVGVSVGVLVGVGRGDSVCVREAVPVALWVAV